MDHTWMLWVSWFHQFWQCFTSTGWHATGIPGFHASLNDSMLRTLLVAIPKFAQSTSLCSFFWFVLDVLEKITPWLGHAAVLEKSQGLVQVFLSIIRSRPMSKSEDDGLLLSDLLGTFFVSMVIIILGLLSFSVRLCWRGIPRPRVSVRNCMSLWSSPPVEATLGSPTLDTESPRPQDKTPNGQEVVSVDFSVDSVQHSDSV